MAGFEDLFTDPTAALGYGLLTSQNPLPASLQLMQGAQQNKRQREMMDEDRALKRAALEIQARKAMMPNLEFIKDAGGRIIAMDKNSGYPYMPGVGLQSPDFSYNEAPINPSASSPTAGMQQPPAGLSPKGRLEWEKAQIDAMNPTPADKAALAAEEERKTKQANLQKDMKALTDRLMQNEGSVRAAVGTIDSKFPTLMEGTRDAELDLQNLQSMLTSDNLGLLKGVLSDRDIQMLREISGGGLDIAGSDQRVLAAIKDINQKVTSALSQANGNVSIQNGTPAQSGWSIRQLD